MHRPTSYILLKPGFPLKWMDKWVNPYTHLPGHGGKAVSGFKGNFAALTAVAPKVRSAFPDKIARKVPTKWMDNWVKLAAIAPTFGLEVSVDDAKMLVEDAGYKFMDIRSAVAFAEAHIVNHKNYTINVPCNGSPGAVFVDGVNFHFPKNSKLVIVDQSGSHSKGAVEALYKAGYTNVKAMAGGFDGWKYQPRSYSKNSKASTAS